LRFVNNAFTSPKTKRFYLGGKVFAAKSVLAAVRSGTQKNRY